MYMQKVTKGFGPWENGAIRRSPWENGAIRRSSKKV
jgi:hypothetical protein